MSETGITFNSWRRVEDVIEIGISIDGRLVWVTFAPCLNDSEILEDVDTFRKWLPEIEEPADLWREEIESRE